MNDMASKGRRPAQDGANNNKAKLNEDKVRYIISRIKQGANNKALAAEMEVTRGAISSIRRGKCWSAVANDMDYEPKPMFKRGA